MWRLAGISKLVQPHHLSRDYPGLSHLHRQFFLRKALQCYSAWYLTAFLCFCNSSFLCRWWFYFVLWMTFLRRKNFILWFSLFPFNEFISSRVRLYNDLDCYGQFWLPDSFLHALSEKKLSFQQHKYLKKKISVDYSVSLLC